MELDLAHRAGIEHQAEEALVRLPTTVEDCNPIVDVLPVLLVSCLPKDERKE